jgi:hypothetical protein
MRLFFYANVDEGSFAIQIAGMTYVQNIKVVNLTEPMITFEADGAPELSYESCSNPSLVRTTQEDDDATYVVSPGSTLTRGSVRVWTFFMLCVIFVTVLFANVMAERRGRAKSTQIKKEFHGPTSPEELKRLMEP